MTVQRFTEADPTCFGRDQLTIQGWLDGPPGMGFEGPFIKPEWVAYPADGAPALWNVKLTGSADSCNFDDPACRWFFLHFDPATGMNLGKFNRWIIVAGHLDDPAAATCHYTYDDNWEGDHLDDADAVAQCRTQFVVDSITEAP